MTIAPPSDQLTAGASGRRRPARRNGRTAGRTPIGYVFVALDVRGRGKSEGEWRAFVNDGPDGHDAVEWIAEQPWCNGKVGTTGLSYKGWTQWATAAERPPHLTCMISTSAAGRWQQEIPYTDGCFQLYFGWWVFAVRRRISELYAIGPDRQFEAPAQFD